ncbi:hypothetical protein NKH45_29290 [Mesorhizobium sp. M1156]|uniref:hypothetical protein n=1 Tax=Mesorhizobium sp. M1156 TaxID=2957064 RepID=UPI003336D3D6
MGVIGAAPSGWTAWWGDDLGRRTILSSMIYGGAFDNQFRAKPPPLSTGFYVR